MIIDDLYRNDICFKCVKGFFLINVFDNQFQSKINHIFFMIKINLNICFVFILVDLNKFSKNAHDYLQKKISINLYKDD